MAQSIGGGGGYGGDAGGILYADGGDGSNGGSGNTVTLNLSGTLRTSGTLAHGAVAQSIGGGGGAGGAAYSTTVGPVLSVAGAVGGSGGGGGFGKAANVTLDNSMIQTGGSREVLDRNNRPTTVDDVDSIGVVVQSIGGGGGQGGGASALAVAIAVPLPLEGASSTEPTIAVAHAVGGSGGNGGSGSNANFAMRGGSSIGTTGAGSHGVLLQSVGGGGGNGGDSSSLAAAVGFGPIPDIGVEVPQMESLATNVSIAVGGKCSDSDCHGGHGGAATLTIGEINSPGRITTRDDAAYGALAQSIGGGGGNAGIGSANVNSIATGSDHNVTISVGRQGGDGGDGDAVTATVNQGSEITTSGAGSVGLAAQSIGGGGGTGTGSTASLEGFFNASGQVGPVNVDVSITPTITMGANGGYGGHGGTVTVTNNGTITTRGADAPAILAQSIGGGGGVGGTAGMTGTDGADGNAALASAAANLADGATITLPTISFNPTLTLGGGYGSSRAGGSVHVIQSSTAYIGTTGDYSPGIVAQSISGGGGRGGIGLASGSANSESSTAIRLGGGGGSNGGAVTVDLNGGVIQTGLPTAAGSTAGFQSFGILAQSIGAGGGTASDATIDPNSTVSRTIDGKLVQDAGVYLGAGWFTGGGSSAGDGGAVSLDTSGKATVTTQGHAAHGIVLQSVGGGGGVVGSGVSAGIGLTTAGRRLEAVLGSGWYASGGSGGGVTMALDSPVSVSTNGHGAFGLLAQSVGAGGGIYAAVPGSNVSVELGRSGSAQGNGGTVTVQMNDRSSTVETTGVGAHAVVAQSVGGGGGIVTSYGSGETPALLAATSVVGSNTGGNGGSVSVNSAATVTTHGAGAHGIIAQSIGGGGGLIGLGANSAGGGGTFLGTTATGSGQGGTVHVSVSQDVTARGTNAIGIFAQSAGPSGGNTITVDINPGSAATTVTGGSGADGAGIVVSGGNNSNLVTVNNGGTVTAASNTAIRYLGDRLLNVQNHGKIEGSTYLNGGSVDGNPQIGGAPASAALLDATDAAPQGTLTNHGTLAARAGQVSVIGGHLVQGATGRLVPEADFVNRSAGSFQVQGDAALDGFVRPQLVSVLPDVRLPVLNVSGTTTGSLTPQDTALFSFRLEEANGQHELSVAGTHFRRPEFGLDYGRLATAGALESMFLRGNEAYGTFFAHLDAAAESDPSLYAAHLHQLSPRAAMSVLAQPTASATAFADASMSCPVFSDGYIGSQSFLTEGNCAYFRPGLRTSQLDGDSSRGSLRTDTATWQLGGQSEVAPGLFLGGSLAYETDWMRSGDGVKGDGSSGLAAITLKYQTGPVLLTGAVFGSAGSLDLQRPVNVPGHSMLAKGSTSTYTAGVRARAAYTFGGEGFYLRPYLNLDVIHAHTDSFRENGAGELGLGYDSTSNTTGIFTPALEVGGRFVLGPQSVLRGFVSAGVSLRTDDEWRGRVRLLGASPESGTFSLGVPMDSAAARVSAGLQLFQGEQFDLRAQYDGTYGDRTHTHGGSLTFAYRF
ncbi:outer membrane autotransporter barrel domain protein [Acetobacteraceae bacterium AT-5844]|nr:outer membrane autotransporter barrel domain protein [Acetobacteraceae bacterium AT-5844]